MGKHLVPSCSKKSDIPASLQQHARAPTVETPSTGATGEGLDRRSNRMAVTVKREDALQKTNMEEHGT